jgi:hypothetical protein
MQEDTQPSTFPTNHVSIRLLTVLTYALNAQGLARWRHTSYYFRQWILSQHKQRERSIHRHSSNIVTVLPHPPALHCQSDRMQDSIGASLQLRSHQHPFAAYTVILLSSLRHFETVKRHCVLRRRGFFVYWRVRISVS